VKILGMSIPAGLKKLLLCNKLFVERYIDIMKANCTKLFLTAVLLLLYVTALSAGTSTTAATFLKIEPSARVAGMGGAFAGITDDINALYYNPSGLCSIQNTEFTATYTQWIVNIMSGYVGVGFPYPKMNAAAGVSITYLGTEDIEARDDSGVLQTSKNLVNNSATAVCISHRLLPILSWGTNIKYITQKLGAYSGDGIAADFGVLFNPFESLGVGLSILNIGTGIKVAGITNDLPMSTRIGVGYRMLKNALVMGFDIELPGSGDMAFHLGGEYLFAEKFYIRAGYGGTAKDAGELKGLTAGLGFKTLMKLPAEKRQRYSQSSLKNKEAETNVDYALVTYGSEFGPIHRVSVTVKF